MKKSMKAFVYATAMAAIGLAAPTVHAQSTVNANQTALMTVTLTDVLAINVNTPAVPLTYTTAEDYQSGKTIAIPAHILVSSNRPYDLKVKANSDLTFGVGAGATTIPINNVNVRVTSSGMGTTPTLPLSLSDVTIASRAPGAMAKLIDVTYSTAPNNPAFVNTGIYTATLTYSATSL